MPFGLTNIVRHDVSAITSTESEACLILGDVLFAYLNSTYLRLIFSCPKFEKKHNKHLSKFRPPYLWRTNYFYVFVTNKFWSSYGGQTIFMCLLQTSFGILKFFKNETSFTQDQVKTLPPPPK